MSFGKEAFASPSDQALRRQGSRKRTCLSKRRNEVFLVVRQGTSDLNWTRRISDQTKLASPPKQSFSSFIYPTNRKYTPGIPASIKLKKDRKNKRVRSMYPYAELCFSFNTNPSQPCLHACRQWSTRLSLGCTQNGVRVDLFLHIGAHGSSTRRRRLCFLT